MMRPPMPPSRVFATPEHREAAAAIVATVNLGHDRPELLGSGAAELIRLYDEAERIDPLDVIVAASVIVTKLLADERTVWHVNPRRTIARLGAWVAGDELAQGT